VRPVSATAMRACRQKSSRKCRALAESDVGTWVQIAIRSSGRTAAASTRPLTCPYSWLCRVQRIQSYLVQTPHHNILVDSCVGYHKPRPTRPFWNMLNLDRFQRGLADTGVSVDQIDCVMCTHLHVDHVGWNTSLEDGRWVPTFPKAKYVFSDRELAYWTDTERRDPSAAPWITDSVLPIVAAKREEVVKSDYQFSDLIKLLPTPGHTIDHYSVQIGRPGAGAVITSDMIHSPLQARYPDLGMRVDYSSPQAGESRRKLFSCLCDTPTLVCTAHFPSPSSGRIRRWDDGFKFEPV
jgi:glyoxylase-like metal-dependent hydrolase (beta-lactamase superfamily II)